MDPDGEASDPGLARERTGLAWNRSGLAIVVGVAVILRHLWPLHGAAAMVAIGSIAAAAMVWGVAMFELRRHQRTGSVGSTYSQRALGLMTIGTLAIAVGGAALSVFTP